jgi:hypothetical protein
MGFLGQIPLTAILSVLLFIASIWLLIIIVQKRSGYMFRAMVFFLFVLLALLYLQQSDAKKYTINDLRLALFPETTPVYNYSHEGESGNIIASYNFNDPKPRLKLTMGKSGKYFHITDVSTVNRVLAHLKLPKVQKGVQELASLTGSDSDNSVYRWDDYPKGILIIYRTLCRKRETLETFNCLERIIIRKKYRD